MNAYRHLIEQCIAGDSRSQRELYETLKGKLFGICLRYNKNREDAEDVFQETVIRIFRNLKKALEVNNFDAWVNRIATNAAIDGYNKRVSNLTVSLRDSGAIYFSSHDVSIVDRLEAEEILMLLHALPGKQMMVFNLYMIDGYSHKEIADRMKMAESTSRVLLTRAKRKMVELIKEMKIHERYYG